MGVLGLRKAGIFENGDRRHWSLNAPLERSCRARAGGIFRSKIECATFMLQLAGAPQCIARVPSSEAALPTQRNESVTVTFHYLTRKVDNGDAGPRIIPFTSGEFDSLFHSLSNSEVDLDDEAYLDRLRLRMTAPTENVIRVNSQTIFGLFKGSYWGHAYDNTARGRIPADSVSLRPFHFLLYLSDRGRIYVGSQYLGQFGGYTALKNAICESMINSSNIHASTYRLGASYYRNAQATEVRVTFSDRSSSITGGNAIANSGMIAFKKHGRDSSFSDEVSQRILPLLGRPNREVKSAIAALVSESELLDLSDEDIENCTVIANVNGSKKTIYMLDDGNFASKFPIDVAMNADGHPLYEPTKAAMLQVLRDEIIARTENV